MKYLKSSIPDPSKTHTKNGWSWSHDLWPGIPGLWSRSRDCDPWSHIPGYDPGIWLTIGRTGLDSWANFDNMNSLYLIRFFICGIGVLSTLIIFFSICCWSYLRLKGSLGKGGFERRTSTGSEVFFIFKHLDGTKFVFPSVFSIRQTTCPKIWAETPTKN